jgi:hypothetical protein
MLGCFASLGIASGRAQSPFADATVHVKHDSEANPLWPRAGANLLPRLIV